MQPDEANALADYLSTVFLDDSIEGYDMNFTAAEARRGQELYGQLGCPACHQLGTKGGYVGPELSATGARLKPGWIAAWLIKPSAYKAGHAPARLRFVQCRCAGADGVSEQPRSQRQHDGGSTRHAMTPHACRVMAGGVLALALLIGCKAGPKKAPGDPMLDAIRAEERAGDLSYTESQR